MRHPAMRDPVHPIRLLVPLLLLAVAATATVHAEDPPAEGSDTSDTGLVLEGWIVDPEGKPLEGANVLAVSASAKPSREPRSLFDQGGGEQPEQPPVASAQTDAEGRFHLEVRGPAPFIVRADAPGYGATRLREVSPGEMGTIALTAGWTLEGWIIDQASGNPVPGAEVKVRATYTDGLADEEHGDHFKVEATADGEGRFRFQGLESNYYRVSVVAEGFSTESMSKVEVGLYGQAPKPLYFYLVPGATFSGKVVDADGAPIEEVRVFVKADQKLPSQLKRWMKAGDLSVETDEEGAFEIRGVPPAPAYVLQAGHEDYATTWLPGLRIPEGGRSAPLSIVMHAGTELTARLLVDGEPFRGKVKASLSYKTAESRSPLTVYREEKGLRLEAGKLTLLRLPSGTARLSIEADGFTEVTRKEIEIPSDQPVDLGEILLAPGRRITGKVLDSDGKPVAEAQVDARSFAMGAGMKQETARSRDDGTFSIGGLDEGAYEVIVRARGFGKSSVKDIEPDGEPVEIRLEPAGKIAGRVLAGDPPKPLAGFSVEPEGKPLEEFNLPVPIGSFGRSKIDFREPSGEFEVSGLAQGTYGIEVTARGFMAKRKDEIEVAPGETADVGDIVLEAGVTLYGTIAEAGTMKPIGGATVQIEKSALFNMSAFDPRSQETAEMTGPDGRFTLSGLAPGSLNLKIRHERYSPQTAEVDIVAGVPPADVIVEMGAGGAVEGTLRNSAGELIPGGMVMLMQGFAPDPDGMVSTDEYGHFRVDRLTPGSYRIMAMPLPGEDSDPGAILGQMQMQTVEVVEGKTTIVNIPPETGGVMVSGVVRRGAKPVEARMFWVRAAADGTTPEDFAAAVSDESGAYQVRLSGPGEYRVSVQVVEDRSDQMITPGATVKVEVPEGEQVTRDVVVPEIVIAGIVLDADTGEPLGQAMVAAMEHEEGRPDSMSPMVGSAFSDAEGRYELQGLAEGEYKIVFSRDGYGAEILGPMTLDDYEQEDGLNVSLIPASKCKVVVTTENGDPIEGAWVMAMSIPGAFMGGLSTQTDADGEAVLTGFPEGSHEVGVIAGGLAPRVVEGVMVGGEEETRVVVKLSRGASLTVRVVDGEDRPVSNAAVRIKEENGPDLFSLLQIGAIFKGRGLVTGPEGSLQIPNLETGRYEIEVLWQDRVAQDKVRVTGSGPNEIEIELK